MAASSQFNKEAMLLGKKLIEELGDQYTVNTLDRWMVHYLAEKLTELDKKIAASKKKKLEKEVIELIFKIWDRKKETHSNLRPLKGIENTVEVLNSMIENEPTDLFSRYAFPRKDKDTYARFGSKLIEKSHQIARVILNLSLLRDEFAKSKEWNDEFGEIINIEEKVLFEGIEVYLNMNENGDKEATDESSSATKRKEYVQKSLINIDKLVSSIKEEFEKFRKALESEP